MIVPHVTGKDGLACHRVRALVAVEPAVHALAIVRAAAMHIVYVLVEAIRPARAERTQPAVVGDSLVDSAHMLVQPAPVGEGLVAGEAGVAPAPMNTVHVAA